MNTLYFGDNLDVLRKHVADESIDLIYLDPPFNSKRDYNVIFREATGALPASQMQAFEDTWHWTEETARALDELKESPHFEIAALIEQFQKVLGKRNDVTAYLAMMAPRLIDLHRVLRQTGSLYLHCDPTASHYLKMLMDAIFGPTNFVNEIIWHYRKWPTGRYTFQRNHDVLLFYAKTRSRGRPFNQLYMERAPSTLKRFGTAKIVSGVDESGRRLPSETEDHDSLGVRQDDVWEIGRVPPVKQLFPTEKPLPLLERIVLASSNEGDLVLDPFCGCGTAVAVAQRLKRRWIGIDVTYLAINLVEYRLKGHELTKGKDYQVIGEPKDAASALALAQQDKWQFQFWAMAFVGAFPVGGQKKKGSDKGIDGLIPFVDGANKEVKRIIVQVKGGEHVGSPTVRDLGGVVEREKAALGFLICVAKPTKDMREEAAHAGMFASENWGSFPKLQIRTVEQLFSGQGFEHPRAAITGMKAAPKAKADEQLTL
jgi:site-specific DNA-methyltransferase (adenine-specific)